MSKLPSVIVDTSVLRTISPRNPGPEIGLLSDLCGDGKLALVVPEVAWNEWKTQFAEAAKKEIEETTQMLRKVSRRVGMFELEARRECSSFADILDAARDSLIADHVGVINNFPFRMLHIAEGAGKRVMDAYFAGKPPFKQLKARKDIPDAFIFDACESFASKHPNSIFVCKDGPLCSAVAQLGLKVVHSFSDLLMLEQIKDLHNDPQFARWWANHFSDVVKWMEHNEDEVVELVLQDELLSFEDLSFVVPEAPANSRNFSIIDVHKIYSVEFIWDMAHSGGEGILRVPMKWNCEVDIEFQIPNEVGYSMPWYSIDTDSSSDGFTRANGECELELHADILIGYRSKPDLKTDFSPPSSLKVENVSHADTYTSGSY